MLHLVENASHLHTSRVGRWERGARLITSCRDTFRHPARHSKHCGRNFFLRGADGESQTAAQGEVCATPVAHAARVRIAAANEEAPGVQAGRGCPSAWSPTRRWSLPPRCTWCVSLTVIAPLQRTTTAQRTRSARQQPLETLGAREERAPTGDGAVRVRVRGTRPTE
jgi:hypothetical protein